MPGANSSADTSGERDVLVAVGGDGGERTGPPLSHFLSGMQDLTNAFDLLILGTSDRGYVLDMTNETYFLKSGSFSNITLLS